MLLKSLKIVNNLVGIVGITVAVIYWFDLDDKMVAAVVPKLKKKAEAYAAAKEGSS